MSSRPQYRLSLRSLILGIETSCDDTGVAVIDQSGVVLSDLIQSQRSVRMGGVIPTFAMQDHAKNIHSLVTKCLEAASVTHDQLSAVAVSNRPGLKGPLIIGTDYAKLLCLKHRLPMIPVHHMEAHALTARMIDKTNKTQFPFLVLLISGGHCLLALATDIDQYQLLGSSVDNSPGECLDKCARMLGLHNMPGLRDVAGGRAVERVASTVNNQTSLEFPVPMRQYRDCRFSFAGVKATIFDHVTRVRKKAEVDCDEPVPGVGEVCAALQHCVTKHLCERVQRGLEYLSTEEIPVNSLVVSGGVASNAYIRQCLDTVAGHYHLDTVYPPPHLCTDNGVMIAWNGLERWRVSRGVVAWDRVLEVGVETRVALGEDWHSRVEQQSIKCKWIKL